MSDVTMSCEDVQQDLLDALADRSGTQPPRSRELTAHLEQCPACRAALADYERIAVAIAPTAGERSVRPDGGWAAFEERLQQTVAPPAMRMDRPQRPQGVAFGVALGMAASILLFGVAFWLGHRSGSGAGRPPQVGGVPLAPPQTAQLARLGSADVSRQVEAFEQVSDVFDRRASWVMTSDSASDMGLASQPIARDARILLLRLAMVRGDDVVSRTDLAIVPGQSAILTVPFQQGRTLRYQIGTTTNEPTRLSIWVEVQTPAGGETLAALATQLDAEPGHAVSAGRLTTAAGMYELQVDFARAGTRRPAGPATSRDGRI